MLALRLYMCSKKLSLRKGLVFFCCFCTHPRSRPGRGHGGCCVCCGMAQGKYELCRDSCHQRLFSLTKVVPCLGETARTRAHKIVLALPSAPFPCILIRALLHYIRPSRADHSDCPPDSTLIATRTTQTTRQKKGMGSTCSWCACCASHSERRGCGCCFEDSFAVPKRRRTT